MRLLPKKYLIGFSICFVLAVLISIWIGGKERWRTAGINLSGTIDESQIEALKLRIDENPDSMELKYNLGCFYYKTKQYEKANEIFSELINSNQGGRVIQQSTFYNMGNVFFRIAEAQEDLSKALENYQQSLVYYRGGIDKQEQEKKYINPDHDVDSDMKHNYALTLKRIKIIADKLRQKEKEAASQQELFQLLKEVKDREAEILAKLDQLKQSTSSKKQQELKVELLKQRQKNAEKLVIIREKITKLFTQSKQSPPVQQQTPPLNQPPVLGGNAI